MAMGWFLFVMGLIRLDEEGPAPAGPAWGWFGRLLAVWVLAAGLAAVKLVPLWPILREHLRREPPDPWAPLWWRPVLVWTVLMGALALVPVVGRLMRGARTRLAGVLLLAASTGAVLLAVAFWADPPPKSGERVRGGLAAVLDRTVSFGTWDENELGIRTPCAGRRFADSFDDRFRLRAPAGPVVAVLALVALILHPRRTWRWGVLLGLFLAFELSPVLPRDLARSWGRLPLLRWIRRPWEPLNFYYFFLLTLLSGRALELPARLARSRLCRGGVWVLVGAHVLFLGSVAYPRYAYSVSDPLPEPAPRGRYELLDRRGDRWRQRPAFLLRSNIGLIGWDLDFNDDRHLALVPSLLADEDGTWRRNPLFRDMAWFLEPENRVLHWDFTPNLITVRVRVERPGVLVINQINDPDWRTTPGTPVEGDPLLKVRLERTGMYTVVVRYRPRLLFVGLGVSVLTLAAGLAALVLDARRRRRVRRNP